MGIRIEDIERVDFADVVDTRLKRLPPTHPGVILRQTMEEMGLSQYAVSKALSVPPRRINEIVHGKRGITADTALRLSRYFGTSAQFWMNLQVVYDLEKARRKLGRHLQTQVKALAA